MTRTASARAHAARPQHLRHHATVRPPVDGGSRSRMDSERRSTAPADLARAILGTAGECLASQPYLCRPQAGEAQRCARDLVYRCRTRRQGNRTPRGARRTTHRGRRPRLRYGLDAPRQALDFEHGSRSRAQRERVLVPALEPAFAPIQSSGRAARAQTSVSDGNCCAQCD